MKPVRWLFFSCTIQLLVAVVRWLGVTFAAKRLGLWYSVPLPTPHLESIITDQPFVITTGRHTFPHLHHRN